jgi:hypothetical protein
MRTLTPWDMFNKNSLTFYRIATGELSERNETIHRYMSAFISWTYFKGKRKLSIRSLNMNEVNVFKVYRCI